MGRTTSKTITSKLEMKTHWKERKSEIEKRKEKAVEHKLSEAMQCNEKK